MAGKLAAASATGVVLGAAAAVESPIIAGAAVVAGTVTTGFALWNSYARLSKNEKLEHALNSVYKYGDSGTMRNSLKEACDAIGPEAFDYGIAMAGMPVGIHGPRTWSNLSANYFANKLVPYMPLGEVTAYRAIEMRLSDGSSLHMHGEEAIYRIGNAEHKLSVLSSNGVELGMRASYMGRQVLKGHTGSNAIEIEINPLTGITKVKDGQISKYKHSWLANQRLPFFSALCEECRPFRRSVQKSKRSEEFDL